MPECEVRERAAARAAVRLGSLDERWVIRTVAFSTRPIFCPNESLWAGLGARCDVCPVKRW